MKRVELHELARKEINQAADYYEAARTGLGRRFRLAFEDAVERIVRRPKVYPIERNDVCRCPLDGFPYNVFYLDEAEAIWIIAVAHHHRRPKYWAKRKPS